MGSRGHKATLFPWFREQSIFIVHFVNRSAAVKGKAVVDVAKYGSICNCITPRSRTLFPSRIKVCTSIGDKLQRSEGQWNGQKKIKILDMESQSAEAIRYSC